MTCCLRGRASARSWVWNRGSDKSRHCSSGTWSHHAWHLEPPCLAPARPYCPRHTGLVDSQGHRASWNLRHRTGELPHSPYLGCLAAGRQSSGSPGKSVPAPPESSGRRWPGGCWSEGSCRAVKGQKREKSRAQRRLARGQRQGPGWPGTAARRAAQGCWSAEGHNYAARVPPLGIYATMTAGQEGQLSCLVPLPRPKDTSQPAPGASGTRPAASSCA